MCCCSEIWSSGRSKCKKSTWSKRHLKCCIKCVWHKSAETTGKGRDRVLWMGCDLICGTGRHTLTAEGVGGVTKFRGGMNARRAKWGCADPRGSLVFILKAATILSVFSMWCFGCVLCNLSGVKCKQRQSRLRSPNREAVTYQQATIIKWSRFWSVLTCL